MTARPPPTIYHGVMMLRGSYWVVGAEPAAMMMLKRVLVRVNPMKTGEVRIKRSPEIDRVLQWFLDLYPLELTGPDKANLHDGAEESRKHRRVVATMAAGTYTPRQFQMAVPPRDYQCVAADAWHMVRRMLLADQTGVGKTASAITGLSDPARRPALIGVPNSVMIQWQEQIERFLPGSTSHIIKSRTAYDIPAEMTTKRMAARGERAPFPDFVICPYSRIEGWAPALAPHIKSIVWDEVQALQHNETKRWEAAHELAERVENVLGMSATPIHNLGGSYWSVLEVIRPGFLGDQREFNREFCHGVEGKMAITDPRAFGLHLDKSGVRLLRTRRDVGREMPPVTIAPFTVPTDMRALDAIQGRLGELCRFLTSGYAGGGSRENMDRGVASRQLDGLMRQATGMGKAPAVAEFVNGLIRDGERPVVFAHHTEVHAILRTLLKEHSPAVYTGAESGRQRQEALRRFKDRETPLLIMGLRVGNAGLDGLQHHSRTVVLAELDWSDVIHHQCISRVDRDGQPEPVTAYVPMSKSGSDPVVADVCGVKKAQHVHIDNPDDARIPEEHVDPGHAKRLAEEWLARRK